MMRTEDFNYDLPDELIAQRPPAERGDSRMMVVDRKKGTIEHRQFADFPDYVQLEEDLLVLNDTRVEPARFFSNDGKKEILKLDSISPTIWRCLVKPGKRMREGHSIEIGEATGKVIEILPEGDRLVEFDRVIDPEKDGHLALPPYITRPDEISDRDRYQTVFARETGAIAAPTAGLHFSTGMLEALPHAFVTLHVGVGTFRPVSVDDLADHHMHSERLSITSEAAKQIEAAKRVIAIGTTSVRVLESCGRPLSEMETETEIFIFPPYDFQVVDGLLTNFHLPKSTLLMLVSALAGKELMLEAYAKAVEERYRFFSYGDCMLII